MILSQISPAQVSSKKKSAKGPRAIGLLQLAPTGKATLIPVAILIDGDYYDASAYKATPVPMALESGTVYEAISTGVSQGLFTVAGALQSKNSWMGEGTWQPAGSIPAKKAAAPSKPPDEDVDKPPVLRRPGAAPTKPPEAAPAETKPPETKPEKPPEAAAEPPSPAVPPAPPEDPDRPVLRRGKSKESPKKAPKAEPAPAKPATPAPVKAASASAVKLIPAISDSNVQEPRSFDYKMKPDEEAQFHKKMLAMASDEVNARVKMLGSATAEAPATGHPAATGQATPKAAAPEFDDVKMRVFDLVSNNEPVLVLTATARPKSAKGAADLPSFVTLVARNDIYGELHKVFSNITDAQHSDVVPQMELIDAVDADGDGRGELFFRRSSDTVSAYSIYRVIGNQLYPLFEGKM